MINTVATLMGSHHVRDVLNVLTKEYGQEAARKRQYALLRAADRMRAQHYGASRLVVIDTDAERLLAGDDMDAALRQELAWLIQPKVRHLGYAHLDDMLAHMTASGRRRGQLH